jgi:protease secretion system membrane fusion protein
MEESLVGKRQRLKFMKEQLVGVRELAKEGYVARNRLLDLEQVHAQAEAAIAEDMGNIGRIRQQVAELKLRTLQRRQEYRKEVHAQLSEVQKEADSLANRLKGLDYDLANSRVIAPVDGTIVGVNVFTEGGVVGPGFLLMSIVPSGDELVVEGQVPVHLIDKVLVGLPIELIFSALNQNLTPRVPAVATQVSADRFIEEKSGAPYYKLRAQVSAEGMKMIAGLQIRPGMSVDMFVKTGERTMMNYLLRPIYDHLKMSLTEQ